MEIKKANYVGSWYPGDPIECEEKIQLFSKSIDVGEFAGKSFSACISPHAGWYFSGKIACNVIQLLRDDSSIDVIVLFGRHLHELSPATILTDCLLETPFGMLEIDNDFSMELMKKLNIKKESAVSFGLDNTIELQLPFIRYFFSDIKLVIIGSPLSDYSVEIGKKVVETATEMNLKIKIIGSTDMTHYGDNFDFTPAGTGIAAVEWVKNKNDQKMIEAMKAMDLQEILRQAVVNRSACCGGAVISTVAAAKELGVQNGYLIGYSNSYDLSAGDSFVGYGGVVY